MTDKVQVHQGHDYTGGEISEAEMVFAHDKLQQWLDEMLAMPDVVRNTLLVNMAAWYFMDDSEETFAAFVAQVCYTIGTNRLKYGKQGNDETSTIQ